METCASLTHAAQSLTLSVVSQVFLVRHKPTGQVYAMKRIAKARLKDRNEVCSCPPSIPFLLHPSLPLSHPTSLCRWSVFLQSETCSQLHNNTLPGSYNSTSPFKTMRTFTWSWCDLSIFSCFCSSFLLSSLLSCFSLPLIPRCFFFFIPYLFSGCWCMCM